MMLATVAWGFVCLLRETYTPTILKKKARIARMSSGDERYWSRYDEKKLSIVKLLRINLTRPLVMLFTEPIWYVVSYQSIKGISD